MRCSIFVALCVLAGFSTGAVAQLTGNQTFIDVSDDVDRNCRVAGFAFDGVYYLAYVRNEGASYPAPPMICYGATTASSANPPVLGFQNPSSISIPNVPSDYNLTHSAAAILNNAPYLFSFKCEGSGNPGFIEAIYQKLNPAVIAGNAPTFTGTGTVTSSSLTQPIHNLYNVSAAALGSKIYLFLLTGTGSKPTTIQVMSYGGAGTTPQSEPNYTLAEAQSDNTIQDVDATNVTLASGEQAIVVTACYVGSGTSRVKAWLFTGHATSPVTLPPYDLSNPPYAEIPGSVRIVYGPAQGSIAINSCTLFFAAVDNGFFGPSSQIYTAQLALPASLESGILSEVRSWTRLQGIWQNSRNEQYSQYPYAWTAFPASLPSGGTTNGYSDVCQYITLFQKGLSVSEHTRHDSLVSSLALQLKLDAATAGDEWISSDTSPLSPADQQAAVQSWNLLGVITGLPPLPAGTVVNYRNPTVVLNYDNTRSGSKQVSQTSVVTAGATAAVSDIDASATYTNSSQQGSTSSTSISLALNLAFHSDAKQQTYDKYDDLGFLVVSQPNYVTGRYDIYAYDGTTPLGLATETISTSGTTLATIPFYLDNPAAPYPNEPACIYESFPVDSPGVAQVTYPLTTDIAGWESPEPLTAVTPLFPSLGTQILSGSDVSSTQVTLTSSSSNAYSHETSNKIKVGGGVTFLGIGGEGSQSFTLKSKTSIVFSTTDSSQIAYPQLQDSEGYTQIELEVDFDKLDDAATAAPNWMPTIFQGSEPWVLTWKVLSATPTGTTTSGGTGGGEGGCGRTGKDGR
jgi:hypothetical protein